MNLKDFPRPLSDNGKGIHFELDVRQQNLDVLIPLMVQMGMKWGVFYVGDELQAQASARAAWQNGIMPILRPKTLINGNYNWEATVTNVLKECPAAWIQVFNEPGDPREWRLTPQLVDSFRQDPTLMRGMRKKSGMTRWLGNFAGYNRDIYANNWRNAAERVVSAGGFPGIQTLDRGDIQAALAGASQAILDRLWGAWHCYASNHPVNYPYDDRNQADHPGANVFTDDTCQLSFIEYQEWIRQVVGFYPPCIVTEGGYVMDQSEDSRYPRTTPALHASQHVAIFDQFRGKLANGEPLRDDVFAYCPFILRSVDYYSFSWLQVAPDTVKAVSTMPAFVRKSSWDGPPPPLSTEKLPMGPYCISLDDLKPDPKIWSDQAKEAAILVMTPVDVSKLQQVVDACHPLILARYYNPKYGLARPGMDRRVHLEMQAPFIARMVADPKAAALELFNDMRADVEALRPFDKVIWMGLNEPDVSSREKCQALNAMTIEWAALMHGIGVECGAYALGEGNPPDLTWWKDLEPGIIACNYYVFVHEYAAPDFASAFPWHIGRFTLMLPQLSAETQSKIKILIGESGYDGGVIGLPLEGWFKHFVSMKGYIQKVLQPLADLVATYPQVKACITFAAAWGTAPSFNVGDQPDYAQWIAQLPNRPLSGSGWFPGAMKKPITVNFWKGRAGNAMKAVVVHIAVGNGSLFGLFNDPKNQRSAHFWVSRSGAVEQYVSINDSAWANGLIDRPTWKGIVAGVNPNYQTISIEHEGQPADGWTSEMVKADLAILSWIASQTELKYVVHDSLIGHSEITASKPHCPGPNVPWGILGGGLAPEQVIIAAIQADIQVHPERPVNDQAWLVKYIVEHNLGFPETEERRIEVAGVKILYMATTLAYVWMIEGDNASATHALK